MSVKLPRAYGGVFTRALFWLYVGLLRTSSTGLIKTLLVLSYFYEIFKQNLNYYSELIQIHGCNVFAICSLSQTCHLAGTQPKAEVEKHMQPQSLGVGDTIAYSKSAPKLRLATLKDILKG